MLSTVVLFPLIIPSLIMSSSILSKVALGKSKTLSSSLFIENKSGSNVPFSSIILLTKFTNFCLWPGVTFVTKSKCLFANIPPKEAPTLLRYSRLIGTPASSKASNVRANISSYLAVNGLRLTSIFKDVY